MVVRKKINWLLILQGWAMLWVVIGHAYLGKFSQGPFWENELCNIAYSFHMPLFMLVSGFLFYLTRLRTNEIDENRGGQKWTYISIVEDKSLRLLLPGVVFTLVAFAVKILFPGEMARQTEFSIKEILSAFVYPFDNPFREMWFIVTLFIFFLLTPIWELALKRTITKWFMLGLLVLVHFIHPETTLFSIDRVCTHAIWFYCGLLISKEDFVDKNIIKHPLLTVLIGLGLYTIGRYLNPFIITIGGIVFSFGLAIIADRFLPKLFFSFRDYTYQIFLMGIFFQILVKMLYRHFPIPYIVAYMLCIAMGIYVPVFLSKLVEKINCKPLSLCVGLK